MASSCTVPQYPAIQTPTSGPRSRELLARRSHRKGSAPPNTTTPTTTALDASRHLRMADIFAGIGGFHLAFEQLGARCVFACENNPTARRIYEANFEVRAPQLFASTRTFARDITTVRATDVPDHDILTAGFPCQPFSRAGRQRGFDDVRGQSFFEIVRILRTKRPQAFFLENVPVLARHDRGRTFDTMRAVLTEHLGYSLHTKVLRACDFGLPQLRPRLFMVGFRRRSTRFAFPEPVPLRTTLSDILGGHCDRTVSRTLISHGNHKRHGEPFNWAHYIVDGDEHRLTVKEAQALQGFPPDFILPANYDAAMRLIGNSVAVPAVAATTRQIARSLGVPLPVTDDAATGSRPTP